jgi:tetratricopeptide (TPR) repeat protein
MRPCFRIPTPAWYRCRTSEVHILKIWLLLSILCLLATPASAADERAHARAQFKLGSQHYNLGEYKEALDAFKEAYRSYEDPSFLFKLAQCERQLGHKREAVSAYRAYLNNSENAPNKDSVRQIIQQLDGEIAADKERERAAAEERERARAAAVAPATSAPATSSAPSPATTPGTPALTASAPAHADRTPTYKKWWVWTIVGGVAAAGLATGLALGLDHGSAPSASTSLGTYHPF